jgi:4-hydroxy-2-oxoheptanedioate aldolase
MGINFPMTTRPEDAVTSARAVRYPPAGDRAWGPFLAPFHWGLSMQSYIDTADDEILTVITIEDAAALAQIDNVLATPGIDVAVIGPGDRSISMGFKGRTDIQTFSRWWQRSRQRSAPAAWPWAAPHRRLPRPTR